MTEAMARVPGQILGPWIYFILKKMVEKINILLLFHFIVLGSLQKLIKGNLFSGGGYPMVADVLKSFGFFLILSVSTVFAQDLPELKLNDLVTEALNNNPELKAVRYQAFSTKTRIRQAKAWEPPQIGLEYAKTPTDSFPNLFKDSMETDYFIQQKFPFPGKITAMSKSAESSTSMSEYNSKALENTVIRDIKNAYYDLYLIQKKIRINSETQHLMREFSDIAKRQYEVGMTGQSDLLRAQTELSMLINEGNNLEEEIQVIQAMINTILGRPTVQPLGSVPELEMELNPLPSGDLTAIALESRPELMAMNKNIVMNQAELELAKRQVYPDIMLRMMYKHMEDAPDDYWSTMVSVDIPSFFLSRGKIRGKVEESEWNIMKSKEAYKSTENMVRFQIQEATVNVRTSQNTASLYKSTIIPQAEQTVQSTKAAYQNGKTEIFSLIESSRTLLKAELEYYSAVTQYLKSMASLEQAVGTDVQKTH
jgi:outer membrane protein, heavy metal efflux system